MDDIFLPDEFEDDLSEEEAVFQKQPLVEERRESPRHPSGVQASDYVKIDFKRFVTLVANRAFLDVVERNEEEEVIVSTNLLADLANAKKLGPAAKGPLLVVGGILIGILIAYFAF